MNSGSWNSRFVCRIKFVFGQFSPIFGGVGGAGRNGFESLSELGRFTLSVSFGFEDNVIAFSDSIFTFNWCIILINLSSSNLNLVVFSSVNAKYLHF